MSINFVQMFIKIKNLNILKNLEIVKVLKHFIKLAMNVDKGLVNVVEVL